MQGIETRYKRDGRFEVQEAEFGSPSAGNVLLKVEAAGICGTDLHITKVPSTYVWDTEVLGHEFCGRVVTGYGEWEEGRRAVIDPAIFCGVCGPCRRGLRTNCENFTALGIQTPGGFADYAEVPVSALIPIADDLDPQAAALTEPLACVLYGLRRVPQLEANGQALVLGGGPIGALFAMSLERGYGRRVVVSEPSEVRREHLAKRLDGDVIAPDQLGEGSAFELIVDTTGFLFAQAVELARPGGVILCFGLEQRSGEGAQVLFTQKELTAVSSFAAEGTFTNAVGMLENGVITAEDLVTDVYPLEDIAAAFDKARGGLGLKVILEPGRGGA